MTTPTTKWTFVPSHDSSLTGNVIPDFWEDEDGNRVWENPTPTTTEGMSDPCCRICGGEMIEEYPGSWFCSPCSEIEGVIIAKLTAERDTAQAQCAGLVEALSKLSNLVPDEDTNVIRFEGCHYCGVSPETIEGIHLIIASALATDPGAASLDRLKSAEADSARLEWQEKTKAQVWHDAKKGWTCFLGSIQPTKETLREAIDAASARAKEAE